MLSSALGIELVAKPDQHIELVGGLLEPWAFQECRVTPSPRSCKGTHFESALGTNEYF